MGIKLRPLLASLWKVRLPTLQAVETPDEKEENERLKAEVRARQEALSKEVVELTRTIYWRNDR